MRNLVVCLISGLFLLSCSTTDNAPTRAAKLVGRDWVGEIHAEAAQLVSAVEVHPLADPAVSDLRAKGERLEQAGDIDGAALVIKQAIAVHPDDPALWQWLAENSLRRHDWSDAEHQALHGFDLGPKVGQLCVLHWLTIRAARTENADKPGIASAQAQLAGCQVASQVRM